MHHINNMLMFALQLAAQLISFPGIMSFKNVRSSVHSVSSSSEISSPLGCKNSLISPKSKKKAKNTHHLLSHQILVCSNRSPCYADSTSNSTLKILCCLALDPMLFIIFTMGVITFSKPLSFANNSF